MFIYTIKDIFDFIFLAIFLFFLFSFAVLCGIFYIIEWLKKHKLIKSKKYKYLILEECDNLAECLIYSEAIPEKETRKNITFNTRKDAEDLIMINEYLSTKRCTVIKVEVIND